MPSCTAETPCDECFHEFEHGTDGVDCGTARDLGGASIGYCSGIMRQDGGVSGIGHACRQACAKSGNRHLCASGAEAYCAAHVANYECKCVRPQGTSMSFGGHRVDYDEIDSFVEQNAIKADPRCLYSACGGTRFSYNIIPAYDLACPDVSVTCSISGNISLSNVQASNLDIITQDCGGSTTGRGHNTSPTTVAITATQKLLYSGIAAVAVIFILGAFVFYRAVRMGSDAVDTALSTAARAAPAPAPAPPVRPQPLPQLQPSRPAMAMPQPSRPAMAMATPGASMPLSRQAPVPVQVPVQMQMPPTWR